MPRKTGTGKYLESLTFSVSKDDFKKIHDLADSLNRPAAELLREALAAYLKREGKDAK